MSTSYVPGTGRDCWVDGKTQAPPWVRCVTNATGEPHVQHLWECQNWRKKSHCLLQVVQWLAAHGTGIAKTTDRTSEGRHGTHTCLHPCHLSNGRTWDRMARSLVQHCVPRGWGNRHQCTLEEPLKHLQRFLCRHARTLVLSLPMIPVGPVFPSVLGQINFVFCCCSVFWIFSSGSEAVWLTCTCGTRAMKHFYLWRPKSPPLSDTNFEKQASKGAFTSHTLQGMCSPARVVSWILLLPKIIFLYFPFLSLLLLLMLSFRKIFFFFCLF